MNWENGSTFLLAISTEQGDPASPSQLMAYLERVMDGIQNNGVGVTIQGERINNIRFANDIYN